MSSTHRSDEEGTADRRPARGLGQAPHRGQRKERDMRRFTGKVAFITGAASGIGRAAAIAFAREGAQVAITDRTEAALDQLRVEIEADGEVLAIRCDVSVPEDVEAAVAKT